MSDTQIIELDEDEPAPVPEPWRVGSLTILAAPIVAIAAVIALLSLRDAANPSLEHRVVPSNPPDLVTFAPLSGVIAGVPRISAVEGGEPEILEDQRWRALGPSYPARGDVAEAVLHGAAYVIGGTGTSENGRHAYRYDPLTGVRERVADLPVSLDHAMAATLDDRIYVFGGFVSGRPTDRVFSLGANDTTWTEHSPMPAPRAAGGAVTLYGRIWLVGGLGADGWAPEIWGYSANGRWASGFPPLPTPRDHLAVGTYQGRICAAGGTGGTRAFECYDPVRNEWKIMPELRKPLTAGRAAEAAGWFWVVGTDVHVFTIDHWHFGPRPQTLRAGHALVAIDGALYLIESGLFADAPMEMLRPQP